MPYFMPLPYATFMEMWDGENIDTMRATVPGFFDYYEIDPDTQALVSNGMTIEVGTYVINAGGSAGTLTPEDVNANWQQVNKDRPRYLIDTDDLEES